MSDDTWRYERFLTTIQQRTGLDRDHAERDAMATLETLAERISKSRAEELAEDLPERLRLWLRGAKDRPEEFRVEDFVHRLAEREEVDAPEAARHARVVFGALARVAPAYEIDNLVDARPHEYQPLIGDVARRVRERAEPEIRSFDEFVGRVKHLAALDRLEAERLVATVLELLGERLVDGEVEDLHDAPPEQFREALELPHGYRETLL